VRILGIMKKLRLSSRVRKAFRGSSRGFSMLEVVIAIALLGIIAISVLSALQTAALALISADQRATAESLARSQMEYVRVQDYNEAPLGGQSEAYESIEINPDESPGYTIWSVNRDDEIVSDVIGVPWNSGNNTAVYKDVGLQRIKIVIKHDDKVVVTLEDYKREAKT
jgi:prepilin-type N-terminal cleavage/methylation domain-containing protein